MRLCCALPRCDQQYKNQNAPVDKQQGWGRLGGAGPAL